MKRFILLAACCCALGTSFAQNTTKTAKSPATAQRNLAASGKCALTGYFTDARNHPYRGVEAFIYQKDSSIIASGYSDSVGHYETNSVAPGLYTVKLVYPGAHTIMVMGVTMKMGFNQLSLHADAPAADTTMPALAFIPKPAEKKKSGATTTTTVKTTTTTTTTTVSKVPAKK